MKPTRQSLINAGVRNMKEFGYPSVTADNILTDMVFSRFFASLLECYPHIPEAVQLLNDIKTATPEK